MTELTMAVLTEESVLSGRIEGRDVALLGHFEGELRAQGQVWIGPRACVKARMSARNVMVEGEFEGEIRAEHVAFGASARAAGIFFADRVAIREGAVVDGSFGEVREVPPSAVASDMANSNAASATVDSEIALDEVKPAA